MKKIVVGSLILASMLFGANQLKDVGVRNVQKTEALVLVDKYDLSTLNKTGLSIDIKDFKLIANSKSFEFLSYEDLIAKEYKFLDSKKNDVLLNAEYFKLNIAPLSNEMLFRTSDNKILLFNKEFEKGNIFLVDIETLKNDFNKNIEDIPFVAEIKLNCLKECFNSNERDLKDDVTYVSVNSSNLDKYSNLMNLKKYFSVK